MSIESQNREVANTDTDSRGLQREENTTRPTTHNTPTSDKAPQKPRPKRRKRMGLPFEPKKQDIGEWAYDHRIGLSVMIVAYLILGIVFFSSKIVIGSKPHIQGIYVDLQTLAELEAEKERLEREIELKRQSEIDWSEVRNLQSNDAMLNENLKDDRGTQTSELNRAAEEAAERMAANRKAYEAGLKEAQAILESERNNGDKGKESERKDSKYKGGVTVRFEFKDPIRKKVDLVIPAYRCDTGGQVVVAVTLDRGGNVISARVVSGGDDSMRSEALKAARSSRFNIDNSAPEKHSGTITYTFIPQ